MIFIDELSFSTNGALWVSQIAFGFRDSITPKDS